MFRTMTHKSQGFIGTTYVKVFKSNLKFLIQRFKFFVWKLRPKTHDVDSLMTFSTFAHNVYAIVPTVFSSNPLSANTGPLCPLKWSKILTGARRVPFKHEFDLKAFLSLIHCRRGSRLLSIVPNL
jgi:hypothetical protein